MKVSKPDIPDEKMQFIEKHFLGLLMEAIYFCELSTNSTLKINEKTSFVKISILSAVFAVECAANLLLDMLSLSSKMSEQIDRMPILEKYEFFLLSKNGSVIFDRGCREVQAIQELIKFRNDQVHLTAKASPVVKDKSKPMTFNQEEVKLTNILKLPGSITKLEYSHALTVLQNVDAFFEQYLIRWYGFNIQEVGKIFFDSFISEQSGTFHIQQRSYYDIVPAISKKMGLKFSYLPPPVKPIEP